MWNNGFRLYYFRNFARGFWPIEEIPSEEPPPVAEPAHVDRRAPLCFGGCGRLSPGLAYRLTHDLFANDLAPPFNTMNRRPFDHGPPSGHYIRKMHDHGAARHATWRRRKSRRPCQLRDGHAAAACHSPPGDPGGGDTAELANTLKAWIPEEYRKAG
jgi:hypothetical protein